ncbi:MAG: hypothetical protein LBH85_07175 [Treponema sp.]|nr:hypothetical protein [Treponema sp.]
MKDKKIAAICSLILILWIMAVFAACGGSKGLKFAAPYNLPPGMGSAEAPWEEQGRYPALVYWSTTLSERGYAGTVEFRNFYTAFDGAIQWFSPKYHMLRTRGSYIEWQEFPKIDPMTPGFWQPTGGNFLNNIGPLRMLYLSNRVRAEDLTIVLTDLEEQGCNNVDLALAIRRIILDGAENTRAARNAAAILALKLPFRGTNSKPDVRDLSRNIDTVFSGDKPLYIIVTGRKGAVKQFVERFSNGAAGKFELYPITTTNLARIRFPGDVEIGQSATNNDNKRLARQNKRIRIDRLGDIRNAGVSEDEKGKAVGGVPNRIWNLRPVEQVDWFRDETSGRKIEKQLPLSLVQYRSIPGSAKNGARFWQFNAVISVPEGYQASDLSAGVENYRYLESTGEKTNRNAYIAEWKTGTEAELVKDLKVSEEGQAVAGEKAVVYVMPKDTKRGRVVSPVICFDLALYLRQNSIPKWVDDFDDTTGSTQDKTYGFKTIVEIMLELEGASSAKSGVKAELVRFPVVITEAPSAMRNSKKN